MDNLTLAQKLLGKEKTIENSSQVVNPSSASLIHMIAVTSSSNGEVVLMPELEAVDDWEGEDIIEIDDDGDFEESDTDEEELDDVADFVIDTTDGDGVDIDEANGEAAAFTVADYHEAAVAAYVEEIAEGEAEEDPLPDENADIGDEIDDGDATELPDVGEAEEDALAGEEADVDDIDDGEYTLRDDNSDDESDDPVAGAEISDGYTTAECIGTVRAGDRVAVMIQDGKMVVIGVVGSGDEQDALRQQAQETADEASEAASAALQDAEEAKQAAEETKAAAQEAERQAQVAQQAANEAQTVAGQAKTEAEEAAAKADEAKTKAESAITDLSVVTKEVETVKEDAEQLRTDLESQIETVQTSAEQTFSTKTELSETETTLRKEISDSIAGIQLTLSQDYAKTTAVDGAIADAKAALQSQITANANQISTVVKSVEEAEVKITDQDGKIANAVKTAADAASAANQAKADASEAQTAANQAKNQADAANAAATAAQTAATEAKNKAQQAETELSEAKENLATAEEKLAKLEDDTSANAEDIAQAQAAVEAAQSAVQIAQTAADQAKADAAAAQSTADTAKKNAATAQTAANNAQTSANNAKTAADDAQAAADKAQDDVDALNARVTQAETKIEQNSEAIKLLATKSEVEGLATRLTAAEQKITAKAIISTVSETYLSKTDASNKYSTKTELTQTASDLTTLITTAQNTANTAKNNATNAAKTATNYLNFSSAGLVVGDMTASTLGRNVLIDSDSVDIRNGTKVLASYRDNAIYLGLANPYQTTIDLCNGMAQFSTYSDSDDWNRMVCTSEYGMYFTTSGEIRHTCAYSPDAGQTEYLAYVDIITNDPWYGTNGVPVVKITASKTNVVTSSTSDDYYSTIGVSIHNIVLTSYGEYQAINFIRIDGDDSLITSQASSHKFCNEVGKTLVALNESNTALYAYGAVTVTGALTANSDVHIGGKGYNDGRGGVFVDSDGFIQIQRNHATYHPYISFYLNGNSTTTADGMVRVNQSTGYMEFMQADRYTFDTRVDVAGSVVCNSGLYTGGKISSSDGKAGGVLTDAGRLHLQSSGNNNPYVGFYKEGSTSYNSYISYDVSDGYMYFAKSARYVFDNQIRGTVFYTSGGYTFGCDDTANTATSRGISTIWKDGSSHFIIERNANGLTASFGWTGSSDYATIARIRGQTCQYQNASGTTALSDERMKTGFVSLDRWNAFFDALEPFAFKMKNGNSGRYHFGFKAQQFEQALLDNGLTTQDCAAFVRMVYQPDEDDPEGNAVYEAAGIKAGDYYYGIIYTELIAMTVYQVQGLKAEMKEVKEELQRMKNAS